MLSRSIRKLLPDLEGAIRRAEVLPSSSSAKRRKTDKDGKGVSVRQPELDRFVERAQWVHEIAVAKAYEYVYNFVETFVSLGKRADR